MSARIVWLKTGPLHHPDTGGRIRTLNMLRDLHQRHEITYLSLWPRGTPEGSRRHEDFATTAEWIDFDEAPAVGAGMARAVAANVLTSDLPYVVWKYRSRLMARRLEALHAARPFDLVICDYLFPSWNFLQARFAKRPPSVLFQHNVEAQIWERRAKVARGASGVLTRLQWRRLARFEADVSRAFDGVVAVSPDDARIMRESYGLTNVLGDVPTGVDLDYFSELAGTRRRENFLAFVGSMDWKANSDGVLAFVREVWPALRAKFPDLRLRVIGRRPPQAVLDLPAQDRNIEVTGTVPDVRPCLAGARAMVVPLRIGGGTRLKIFEAMAAGVPVVSTQVGAEGLPVTDGREILLAGDIGGLGAPLERLLGAPELGEDIADRALALVRERFSWAAATRVFEDMIWRVARP